MMYQFHTITKISDSDIEPVSLTDMKNWMRVRDNSDDTLITNLMTSARRHIEKLTGVALTNQKFKVILETSGINKNIWVVDLPYSSNDCTPIVRLKNWINDYTTLTKNTDYEVIGGKLFLYSQAIYDVEYDCGYGQVPDDLISDIMTLVAWSYENRGKKMIGDAKSGLLLQYPDWNGLNYHQYVKNVI